MKTGIKVFKFGGASVKNATAVLNIVNIIKNYDNNKLLIVVSAMGKTTNKLESIFTSFIQQNKADFLIKTDELKAFHMEIVEELFEGEYLIEIKSIIHKEFENIHDFFNRNTKENLTCTKKDEKKKERERRKKKTAGQARRKEELGGLQNK